jgi:hypothetical protein
VFSSFDGQFVERVVVDHERYTIKRLTKLAEDVLAIAAHDLHVHVSSRAPAPCNIRQSGAGKNQYRPTAIDVQLTLVNHNKLRSKPLTLARGRDPACCSHSDVQGSCPRIVHAAVSPRQCVQRLHDTSYNHNIITSVTTDCKLQLRLIFKLSHCIER